MTDLRGQFLWYEVLTSDLAGAVAFYTRVFGWQTEQAEIAGFPYTMWVNNGRPVGGLMQMPDGVQAPPHWLGYVGEPDTAAATARAEELGATIHLRNQHVPTVGTMSVLQDPFGAFIAVYTPETPGAVTAPGIGDVSWHEIATTDVTACLRFYGELFGWSALTCHDMGEMGLYQEYGVGKTPLGGIYNKPADMPAPPHFLYYVSVADLEATMSAVGEHGGHVLMGPHEVPGGDRIAVCADPQGAAFAIHWRKG